MLLAADNVGSVWEGEEVWSSNPWKLSRGILSGSEVPSWVERGLPWVGLGSFGA